MKNHTILALVGLLALVIIAVDANHNHFNRRVSVQVAKVRTALHKNRALTGRQQRAIKLASRVFAPLQSNQPNFDMMVPNFDRAQCSMNVELQTLRDNLNNECLPQIYSLLSVLSPSGGSNTTILDISCNATCVALEQKILDWLATKSANWTRCMIGSDDPPEEAYTPFLQLVCSKADGTYCFPLLMSLGSLFGASPCINIPNEPLCRQNPQCRFSPLNGGCVENGTASTAALCRTLPTITKCAAAIPSFGADANEALAIYSVLCEPAPSGAFCGASLKRFFTSSGDDQGADASEMGGDSGTGSDDGDGEDEVFQFVCNNADPFACLIKAGKVLDPIQKKEAKEEFLRCVDTFGNITSQVDAFCKPYFERKYAESDTEYSLGRACTRNERGESCYNVNERHSEFGARCGEPITMTGQCSERCDAEVGAVAQDMGCCLAEIAAGDTAGVEIPASEYPTYTPREGAGNLYTNGPQPGGSGSGDFARLASCPSVATTIVAQISKRCPDATSAQSSNPCFSLAFQTALEEFDMACATTDLESLLRDMNTTAQVRTAWTPVCASTCRAKGVALLQQYPRCVRKDQREVLSYIKVMCESDGEELCAVRAQATNDMNCQGYSTSAACNAAVSGCKWRIERFIEDGQRKTNEFCDILPTMATLENACSPCLAKLASELGDDGDSFIPFQNMICAKIGTTYCFPLAAETTWNMDQFGLPVSELNATCSNSTKKRCVRKVIGAVAVARRRDMAKKFKGCVEYSKSSKEVVNRCVAELRGDVSDLRRTIALVDNMCLKNSDGVFCTQAVNNAANNACIGALLTGSACTTECDTTIAGIVSTLGCCMGSLHRQLRSYLPRAKDVPRVKGVTSANTSVLATEGTVTVTAGAGEEVIGSPGPVNDDGMWFMGKCASQNATLTNKLSVGCARARGTVKIKRQKKLAVSWKKLIDDAVLKAQLQDSMVGDIATAVGIAPADIVDADLIEDATTTVTTSRRMRVLEESAGVIFSFSVQTSDDLLTQEIASSYDTQSASGEITYSGSSSVTSSSGAADSSVASLAQEAPPPAANQAPSAASLPPNVIIATIATIFAALLL